MQAKDSGKPLNQLILNRYKCEYTARSDDLIAKSTTIKNIIDTIDNGIDPAIYSVRDNVKWYTVSSKEQLEALIPTLNPRGIRERGLRTNVCNNKEQLLNYFNEVDALKDKSDSKKSRSTAKKDDANEIDKNLFETMDDYIEGNLRDQLLEIEERLWVAGLGGITSENRERFRTNIEQGIGKLILSVKSDSTITLPNGEHKSKENHFTADVSGQNQENVLVNGHHENGTVSSMEVDGPVVEVDGPVVTALPLHLRPTITQDEDRSRCSTPVDPPENSNKQSVLHELSEALLQVMKHF